MNDSARRGQSDASTAQRADAGSDETSTQRISRLASASQRPRFSIQAQPQAARAVLPLLYRPYRRGDEAGIVAAFNETFALNRTTDYWRWKFLSRPPPMAMLAVDAAGAVQSQVAGVRWEWHGIAGTLRVAQIGDLFARRDPTVIRSRAMLTTLSAFHDSFSADGQVQLLFGFPNATSAGLHNTRFPVFRGERPITAFAREVDPRAERQAADGCTTTQWPNGPVADELWDRSRSRYGFATRRDWNWLQWRFRARPDVVDYRFLGYGAVDGRLNAWAVLRASGDTLWMCDLLWDGCSDEHLARLTADALTEARELRLGRIALWLQGDPKASHLLKTLGWAEGVRGHDIRFAMHFYDGGLNPQEVFSNLYLTYADSDLI